MTAKIIPFPGTERITVGEVYRLRVELIGLEPAINRVLLVRNGVHLDLLHAILQVAMGWTNSHLHQFIVGETIFSDPEFNLNEDLIDPVHYAHAETDELLSSIVDGKGAEFRYEYDFGDSWVHLITVEDILADDGSLTGFAECVEGELACPPEDIGGPMGYVDFLYSLQNPDDDDHDAMLEWMGGPFDPQAFDMKKVNRALKNLKWNHPTIQQLARILKERDRKVPVKKKTTAKKKSAKRKTTKKKV